jgi:diguanylate cyclase (GGDEF)-like protein
VIDALSSLHPATAFMIVTGQGTSVAPSRIRSNAAVSSLVTKPWDVGDLAEKLELAYRLHDRRAQAHRAQKHTEISVLVVEDSPSDALLLSEHLKGIASVRVTMVSTLLEATTALHNSDFDVIFTDLTLPDARGVDTVLRLRSASPNAAIVVCSGIDDQAMTLQLVHLGAHECIAKETLDQRVVSRALMLALERKAFELRLARLAYYDPLTGAANRAGWQERASYAVERAARRLDRVAVGVLDLDGFKQINDRLGHDVGDSLLQEVVTRLQRLIREYDMVARLGGDEFGLLISDLSADVAVSEIGARVQRELAKPLSLGGEEYPGIRASLGISVFPDNGESLSALVKSADAAMYQAKALGECGWAIATGRGLPSRNP